MGIPDRGATPTDPGHLLTLGAGDARYASQAQLAAMQSQINALRRDLLGDASATLIPCCQCEVSQTYSVSANQDTFAKVMWTAVYDPLNLYSSAGQWGGYTGYASISIPWAGRYMVDLSVVSSQRSGNGAVKILSRYGTSEPTVGNDSIASHYGLPSGSEFPLHAFTHEYMTPGNNIYWSTFHSVAGAVNPSSFGGVTSRMTLYWMGPN